MLREIAFLPNRLLRRRVDRRSYTLETIALVILGLLGGAGMAYVSIQAMDAFGGDESLLRMVFIGEVLTPLMTLFILWVWYAAGSHIVANKLFRGRGPMGRLFRTSAWALLPIGLWFVIRSAVTYLVFRDVDFPADPDGITEFEMVASILDLGFGDSPLYLLTLVLGLLFVAWSWWLLTDAVEMTKNVSRDAAQKVAAVPAGVYGLILIRDILTQAGVL